MQTIDVLINKYVEMIEEKEEAHGIAVFEANFFDEINPDWRELDDTELEAMKENNKQAFLNELIEYYNAM